MRLGSAALGGLLVVGFMTVLSAQEKPKEVAPQETIQFEQDKAQAHMRELEQRMFRLAEMIREAQPEDAARLKLGVERARDALIADRMSQASTLLATLKLEQASAGQKEIIAELEELKRLLLSTDIDLQLKLEQLKKLKDARARIDALIRKEREQLKETTAATQMSRKDDFPSLKEGEERNKRLGEDVEQMLKQFGGDAAASVGAVNGAVGDMASAASQLGQNNGSEASKEQQEAIEKLTKADAKLAELQSELEKDLESFVRQRVMETLAQMIVEQVQVRQTTEKLAPRLADGRKETVVAVKRLSESEEKIVQLGEEALGLCDLVEFSMAFPPALRSVLDQMELVAAELHSGRANDGVIAREKQIEADLQELLNALKQASRPGGNSGSQSGGGGLKDNINKVLAEVKMLRWMEISLNKETKTVQQQFAGKPRTDPEFVARLKSLSEQQERIQTITRRLHDATCEDCLAK
jgi:citrate lyase gamma subunit